MAITYTALGPSTKLTHIMKRNDTLPSLGATFQDSSGVALNLTTASGVTFTMKQIEGDTLQVSSATATVNQASKGQVHYEFTSANTNTAGTYLAEFEITYNDGGKLTVPTQGAISVVILEDYNG